MRFKSLIKLSLLSTALFTSGCTVPVVMLGAAATGLVASEDERSTGTIIDDNLIELRIGGRLGEVEELNESHVNVTVFNGVVLMTGETSDPSHLKLMTQIAKESSEKIKSVVNQVKVAPTSTLKQRAEDVAVTANVKARLTTVKEINPLRVKVVTENGVTYLMGVVTQEQADTIARATATSVGVKKVVKVFEINNRTTK